MPGKEIRMSVSKERFDQGLTYQEYKAQMTRNRERLEENEATVSLPPDDLAYFANLPQPLYVLALAEDWCGDVIANLPVLARLAQESGKLIVRVFLRDQNLDLMDRYLNQGQFRSIPVFVFFDQDFRELGHWIERPARMSELQAQMRRELFATDPLLAGVAPDTPMAEMPEAARNRLREAFAAFRAENRAFSDQEVVRELRAIVEGKTQPAAPAPVAAPTLAARRPTTVTKNGHVKVSITYCAACGYEPQTLDLTAALMREFLYDLAAIEIIPWHDGTFDVAVNGDLLHSMARDGGFPEHATVIQAVRERLA
jgi:selT/selW/selH-like putative selenoprotein